MHKFNSIFLMATPLLFAHLWGDTSQENSPSEQNPAAANPLSQMGVNLAARPVIKKGANLFVSGELLYWQAIEDDPLQTIEAIDGSSFAGNPSKRNLPSLDFDWNFGYRVGAGYNIPRDGWTLSAGWTSIRNKAKGFVQRVTSPNPSKSLNLLQAWGDANHQIPDGIESSRAKLNIDLNQIDLQCGREFYLGKYLTIQPYLGARNAWIDQTFSIFVQNATANNNSQLCKFRNNFWGLGLVGGINTDWKFGSGFSLYSMSDLSILMGFFSVKEKIYFGVATPTGSEIPSPDQLTNGFLASDWDESPKDAVAVLDLVMGLKWSKVFVNNRFGVTAKVGYEYHLYFDQNRYINAYSKNLSPSTINLYYAEVGNLIYQGVAGSLQFDF
ncbi:MAG: Lpg1974 family pore-forming outer membrane protein [Chlamydiota bacterium]